MSPPSLRYAPPWQAPALLQGLAASLQAPASLRAPSKTSRNLSSPVSDRLSFDPSRAVESWFSPSHRMQSACFISLSALLDCGALERARSSLKLALGKSLDRRLGSTVWVAPVSSPRRTMLCPLGRDLGMPKGSAWGHLGQTTMDRTLSAAPRPLVGVLRRSLLWGENLSLRRPKHGPMVLALCQEWLAPWLQVTIDVFHAGLARELPAFVPAGTA